MGKAEPSETWIKINPLIGVCQKRVIGALQCDRAWDHSGESFGFGF